MRLTVAILCLLPAAAIAQINKPLASVATVADLIAREPVTNERLLVTGWRTAGDWGAPRVFRHDPASAVATNLGCVFGNAGAGRYLAEDCESGEVDARWFGATGDGITDDSAAIQSAINSGSKVILIFPGTYSIGTTLEISTNLVLRGDSRSMTEITPAEFKSTLMAADGLNAPILTVDGTSSQITIEGVAFDGNRSNQTAFAGNGCLELLGGSAFIETHIQDVICAECATNAIYVYRDEVHLERVKTVYNDGDGITFNSGYADGDIALSDFTLRSVQSGFNKGNGIAFQKSSALRLYNVDTYQNNKDGTRFARTSVARSYGLQTDMNGQNGVSILHNARDLTFFGGLFYDSNNYQFENYRDSGIAETTNPAATGTYGNVYIDNTGSFKLELAFVDCKFYLNGGGALLPSYLIYDDRGANAGASLTLVDAKVSTSASHSVNGAVNGTLLDTANVVGIRYDGAISTTEWKFKGTVRDTVFSDDNDSAVVTVRKDAATPSFTLERPAIGAWSTYDLGGGYLRSFQSSGQWMFGNTNVAAGNKFASFVMPQYTIAEEPVGLLSSVSTTNSQYLLIGGGASAFSGVKQIAFYTSSDLVNNGGGTQRVVIQGEGQVRLVPRSAPTLDLNDGDIYFHTTNGLTQRRNGAWEILASLPIAPTNNGAYVLFVTNGVASWIAHP